MGRKMLSLPRVLLAIDKGTAYGRGLLKGIAEYSLLHGPWSFYWQEPFYHDSRQGLKRIIREWKPNGIIMRDNHDYDENIITSIPTVLAKTAEQIDSLPQDAAVGIYSCDWRATAEMAAEHLLSQGFKRFAYCGYNDLDWSRGRGEYFESFLKSKGFKAIVYDKDNNDKVGAWNKELPKLAAWLKQLPVPIGLMACNDDRAQQIVEACKFADVLMPDEVAIVGVDNDELICTLSVPQLSSINLNPEKTGYGAAQLLDELMREGNTQKIVVDKPTHIQIRQSTDVLAIDDVEVVKAMRYIRDNIRSMIQLEDVVEQTCLSRRSLELRFKSVLGSTILNEIKKCKTNEICKLLATTGWSITKIAMHLGFSGSDHISRYFRQVKGVSLIEYRKKIHSG